MELALFILSVARNFPKLIADIQALNGADPTPEQLAQWEIDLATSTTERDAIIAAAKERLKL